MLALAEGMASYFVRGVFGAIGITAADAERLSWAVVGKDVPASSQKVRASRRR